MVCAGVVKRGNRQPALLALLKRIFLQFGVGGDEHRSRRLRTGQRIAAHRQLGKMLKRHWIIVPLDEVAHRGGAVLHTVEPFDPGPAFVERTGVSGKNHDGNAVAVGIIEGHGRMLGAHRSVHDGCHRLAGDLGIAMRHADRDFLVHARQPFRTLVLPVVDETFLQRAKRRTRTGGHVVEIECLAHIHHEVRAGLFRCQTIGFLRDFTLMGFCGCSRR